MRILVDKLPVNVSEKELKDGFGVFGQVKKTQLLPVVNNSKAERSAWVEMDDEGEARAAMEALNGEKFLGHPINVRLDVTPQD